MKIYKNVFHCGNHETNRLLELNNRHKNTIFSALCCLRIHLHNKNSYEMGIKEMFFCNTFRAYRLNLNSPTISMQTII